MVDKVLSEPQALAQSGQALPDVQGGKVVGIKLRGVRRDTLLDAIGLKNGDRIESINGFGLESTEKILEAYTRLRAAERLKLQVNRGGQATTLEYEIR
jgi:type II secretory pathway component PulC